ncbi:FadR/GntR family transcriptional regulator [Pollutimonas thiosulfatoxidans]|nr:FadR/GntR family transcriptional regulator [Pollutimonas thiosulfatoxidans]
MTESSLGLNGPIERVSVAEHVANHILNLIKTGGLTSGQKLPTERDLATNLQVSRPTVREALRGLQILGVINIRQGGGVYVSSLKPVDLLQPLHFFLSLSGENSANLHEARVIVEGGLAKHIIRTLEADPEAQVTVKQLRDSLNRQEKLVNDPLTFRIVDMEFHRLVRSLVRNPYLDRMSLSLYTLGAEYRRISWESSGVLSQSYADHILIVEALERRDEEGLRQALTKHMETVHDSMQFNSNQKQDVSDDK